MERNAEAARIRFVLMERSEISERATRALFKASRRESRELTERCRTELLADTEVADADERIGDLAELYATLNLRREMVELYEHSRILDPTDHEWWEGVELNVRY